MKLINIYYQIKYRLNEQEDLDKVTVKNPETGNDIKVTSVLNNSSYEGKPVEKLAKQKIMSIKDKNIKPNPEKKSPKLPKKSTTKTGSHNKSSHLSIANIGNKAKTEADKKKNEETKQFIYKGLAKSIFKNEKQSKDIEKLVNESDPEKRKAHLKKLKPNMSDEDITIVNDLMNPTKQKETFEQMQEAFPDDAKKFNEKIAAAGLTDDNDDNNLDNMDQPSDNKTEEPKEESKFKKVAKKVGLGLLITPAALLGIGVFMTGGVVGSAFGLAAKALDTVTVMVKATMGTDR